MLYCEPLAITRGQRRKTDRTIFMKKEIHPQYYTKAKATCACGAEFEIGSTLEEIRVEVCSACHPFYTGNEKVLDTAGRVEKFKQRRAAAAEKKTEKKTAAAKAPKTEKKQGKKSAKK